MVCGHHIITDGCRHCRELQNQWYRTIAKDFDDAEDPNLPDRPLRAWHNNIFRNTTLLEIEITHDYYEKALELLHTFDFKNKLIKRIWELHCQGLSRHKIEIAISGWSNPYRQSQIRNLIKDLEREIQW